MLNNDIESFLQTTFNDLHHHAEVSWKEVWTTEYIKRLLTDWGLKPITFDDLTGLYVDIGSGSPVVGLRADIDALWQEVGGEMRANHSCGHDAHMTMALGVIQELLNKKIPKGTVRVIFQPAEETGKGALEMVKRGVADDLDFLYGVHLRPENELPNGYAGSSIRHHAACFIKGTIDGEDAHGARPYMGPSAFQVGSDFGSKIERLSLKTFESYSAKITQFQTIGQNPNIIAGKAEFSIDLRAQTNELMDALIEKIFALADGLSRYYGVPIHLKKEAFVAAAVVDREAETFMKEAIEETLGAKYMAGAIKSTGGDDFHFYTVEKPKLKATMLGLGCGLKPGLHHPDMTFDRRALLAGVRILTRVVMKTLESFGKGGERHG